MVHGRVLGARYDTCRQGKQHRPKCTKNSLLPLDSILSVDHYLRDDYLHGKTRSLDDVRNIPVKWVYNWGDSVSGKPDEECQPEPPA